VHRCSLGIRNYARGSVGGHSEVGAAASTKAVWWHLHLASLLTHLFLFYFPPQIFRHPWADFWETLPHDAVCPEIFYLICAL